METKAEEQAVGLTREKDEVVVIVVSHELKEAHMMSRSLGLKSRRQEAIGTSDVTLPPENKCPISNWTRRRLCVSWQKPEC